MAGNTLGMSRAKSGASRRPWRSRKAFFVNHFLDRLAILWYKTVTTNKSSMDLEV